MTATTLAEQALVGALLWDPRRAGDVSRWLRAEDFHSGVDAIFYEAIVGMVADGRIEGLIQALPDVLARHEYEEGAHGLAAPPGPERVKRAPYGDWMARIDERLRTTPASPPSGRVHRPEKYADRLAGLPAFVDYEAPPSEHVRYACMVLEAATRRDVEALGVQIERATTLMLSRLDEPVAALSAVFDDAAIRLAELADRARSSADIHIDGGELPRQRSRVSGRPAAPHGPPPGPEHRPSKKAVERAEMETLAGALIDPGLRAELVERLEGRDFSLAVVGATWDALRALLRVDVPIDYVTLAWAVEGRSPVAGPGLDAEQLLRIGTRESGAAAVRACEVVARAALVAHAEVARREVQQAAGLPGLSALCLVESATTLYRGLGEHARRIGGAERPPVSSIESEVFHDRATRPRTGRGR
jgi:hypothetical protein